MERAAPPFAPRVAAVLRRRQELPVRGQDPRAGDRGRRFRRAKARRPRSQADRRGLQCRDGHGDRSPESRLSDSVRRARAGRQAGRALVA